MTELKLGQAREIYKNAAGDTSVNIRHYSRLDLDLTEVRAVLSEGKCKICAHPDRRNADILIYRQKMKDLNDHGEPFTRAYLLIALAEMGIPNPNTVNIQNHWRKHCEVPTSQQQKHEREYFGPILEELSSDQIKTMTRQDLLDTMMRQGVAEAGARLRATGKSGITVDAVLKIAELQIREKGNEAQNEFLKALGGGIVSAVKNGLPQPRGAAKAKQIAAAEVILAEPVEVEELVA